jgi:hypothetical protein
MDSRFRGNERSFEVTFVECIIPFVVDARSILHAARPADESSARSEHYWFDPSGHSDIHSTCLSALVTDWAMETWYHVSIA